MNYTKGKLNGITKVYFSNKQLHRTVKYEADKLIEVLEFYNKNGEKIDYSTFMEYDLKSGEIRNNRGRYIIR